MAFDTTISGASATSYITVAQADDYFEFRHENDLYPSDLLTKQKLLVSATRRLDAELYNGYKTIPAQALQFPRTVIYDRDGLSYATDAIPQNMINAVCEMIYAILKDDERLMGDDLLRDMENVSSFSGSIDGMAVSYAIRADAKANKLPQEVITELKAMGDVWKKSQKVTLLKR